MNNEILKDYKSDNKSGYKYIYAKKNGWYYIQRKFQYYGLFHTLEEAVSELEYLVEHEWGKLPKTKINPHSYIIKNKNGHYTIVKAFKNTSYSFGTFADLEEAKRWRDFFLKHNWDLNLRDVRKRSKNNPIKNIIQKGNSFIVQKTINGDTTTYDRCRSLKEALDCKEWWIKHNWDLDCIDLA